MNKLFSYHPCPFLNRFGISNLLRAVKKVVTGEEFRVPSDAARRAVRTAVKMMEWTAESEDNMKIFTDFATRLVREI